MALTVHCFRYKISGVYDNHQDTSYASFHTGEPRSAECCRGRQPVRLNLLGTEENGGLLSQGRIGLESCITCDDCQLAAVTRSNSINQCNVGIIQLFLVDQLEGNLAAVDRVTRHETPAILDDGLDDVLLVSSLHFVQGNHCPAANVKTCIKLGLDLCLGSEGIAVAGDVDGIGGRIGIGGHIGISLSMISVLV